MQMPPKPWVAVRFSDIFHYVKWKFVHSTKSSIASNFSSENAPEVL